MALGFDDDAGAAARPMEVAVARGGDVVGSGAPEADQPPLLPQLGFAKIRKEEVTLFCTK